MLLSASPGCHLIADRMKHDPLGSHQSGLSSIKKHIATVAEEELFTRAVLGKRNSRQKSDAIQPGARGPPSRQEMLLCATQKVNAAGTKVPRQRPRPIPPGSPCSRTAPREAVSAEGTPANETAANNAAPWSEVEGQAKTEPLGKCRGGSRVPACQAGGQTSPHRLAATAGAAF